MVSPPLIAKDIRYILVGGGGGAGRGYGVELGSCRGGGGGRGVYGVELGSCQKLRAGNMLHWACGEAPATR